MSPAKKRRPSGPGGRNLGVPISLRATDREQIDRWKAAAKVERRNLSDWIRVTLDARAKTVGRRGLDA